MSGDGALTACGCCGRVCAVLVQCGARWLGHVVGMSGALRKQCNHSVHHQACATLQELFHHFSNFNRTDCTPGLLGHPWGTRVAPSFTVLVEGEWIPTQIILSSFPGFSSPWALLCLLQCKATVQTDGVGDWETSGPVQNRKPSLVAWAHPKRFRVTS